MFKKFIYNTTILKKYKKMEICLCYVPFKTTAIPSCAHLNLHVQVYCQKRNDMFENETL